jgi:hypothetical protein
MTAPPKLIVFTAVMIQWVALLLGLGGLVPYLYERGSNPVLLAVGAVAAFAILQAALGFVLRQVPVRCLQCRDRARFAGFGWWPFSYRFNCKACGRQHRIELVGR